MATPLLRAPSRKSLSNRRRSTCHRFPWTPKMLSCTHGSPPQAVRCANPATCPASRNTSHSPRSLSGCRIAPVKDSPGHAFLARARFSTIVATPKSASREATARPAGPPPKTQTSYNSMLLPGGLRLAKTASDLQEFACVSSIFADRRVVFGLGLPPNFLCRFFLAPCRNSGNGWNPPCLLEHYADHDAIGIPLGGRRIAAAAPPQNQAGPKLISRPDYARSTAAGVVTRGQ